MSRYRWLQAGVALAALVLAACTASPPPIAQQANVPLASPGKQAESDLPPAVQREHQRIVATYGGVGKARPALPGHDAQLAVDQRLRAADRADLRDAGFDRTGE